VVDYYGVSRSNIHDYESHCLKSSCYIVVMASDYDALVARLAEAESTLEHIRDSTYRSAVVLRGVASDYFDRRRTS
jgi:hypothetical protein